ncbi:MAG TPA: 30S ribosomal protein S6 [Candidatus Omnitrophota bacterium]|nr:30S ribosomal protein S6 [Candidatus Omnitrophota bacterium]
MENKELMRKYELMAIIDAKLAQEEKDRIFKEVADIISQNGGKVINSQVWLEKHRLTFPIKKCKEGTYYLVNFESDGSINEKVRSLLKLNERILRFAWQKIEPKVPEAVRS